MDLQDVNMKPPNIKAKPKETAEEMNRRHNSRWGEESGPFGSGSGGLENQRRGLHFSNRRIKVEEEEE